MHYAAAVGKRLCWILRRNGDGRPERRRPLPFAGHEKSLNAIRRNRPEIHSDLCRELADGSNHALETGCFFVRRDLVLTAKHVLEEVVKDQRKVFIANGSVQGRLLGAAAPGWFTPSPRRLALVKVSGDGLHVERPLYRRISAEPTGRGCRVRV